MNKYVRRHTFHIVDPSPWPFLTGIIALVLFTSSVMYMHGFELGGDLLLASFIFLIITMFAWWKDVIREGTFEGHHTKVVQWGLKMGMLLFIVSEIMFFSAFFWGFFHSSISPSIQIGIDWPPVVINILDPFGIPLLNTLILLTSGFTVTWSHHAVKGGSKKEAKLGLLLTIFLGIIFTALQGYEYVTAPFDISDGIYGSTFYMATGFHGFHVIVGTIFLFVGYLRLSKDHYTREHHLGFEFAIWYWHFVDVVWLFLYVSIYYWGSL